MNFSPNISILHSGSVYFSDIDRDEVSTFGKEESEKLQSIFPKMPMRRIPRYARMGLLASAFALENAPVMDKTQIGLVIGTSYPSMQMSMDFIDTILDNGPRLSSPTAFSHAVNNMGAGLLSLYHGLQGPCQTVNQFSMSFAGALQAASTLIHSQRAEYVLVGCIEEYDARMIRTCKYVQNAVNIPPEEGSVFFLVGKEQADLPTISVHWNTAQEEGAEEKTSLQYALESHYVFKNSAKKSIHCHHVQSNCHATIKIGE